MDVTSWLVARFDLVRRELLLEKEFENQELRKELVLLRKELSHYSDKAAHLESELVKANRWCTEMESTASSERRKAKKAEARVDDLKGQIDYLKEQIKIYQSRLGLLPQERQGQTGQGELKPLRQPRAPFAVAAHKIQVQRTEEYWRKRAAEVDGTGTAGTTTDSTPTVSEKES